MEVCTEVANQVQRVFGCVTVEQPTFLPRTYVILAALLISTLFILYMQHRYFRKFDHG